MILLKSHDRLVAVNEIRVVRRLVGGRQENLIARYDVVLIGTYELPNCMNYILNSFDSYEQACKYLKSITWEIKKCSGNYIFYAEDYTT